MSNFLLPSLDYEYDALEPYIDAETMKIHHTKHHEAYTQKLNDAIDKDSNLRGKSINELLENCKDIPAVRNNGGGYYNHCLFWKILSPQKIQPSDKLIKYIDKSFGSFNQFKESFINNAVSHFGSGWAWLCINKENKLSICSTPNQDTPIMNLEHTCKNKPILGIDVWEHAYYLQYQNRRPEYINNVFEIINWKEVEKRIND